MSRDAMPLRPADEERLRANTTEGGPDTVHAAGVECWRSLWATLDVARDAAARATMQAEQVGFAYDAPRDVVTVCGTQFSRIVLEHFRTTSAEDECYQHRLGSVGQVLLTRTVGHREHIHLLRHCMETRPDRARMSLPGWRDAWIEWDSAADVVLNTTEHAIGSEAHLVESLIAAVRAFRDTTRDPDTSLAHRDRQLGAAGTLFGSLELLERERAKLFVTVERPTEPRL